MMYLKSEGDSHKFDASASGWFFVMFLVFLLLKWGLFSTDMVDASWWLVTAPLWLPLVLMVGLYALFLVFMGIAAVFMKIKDNRSMRNLRYRNPPRR